MAILWEVKEQSEASSLSHTARWRWFWLAAMLTVGVCNLYWVLHNQMNGDVAIYLYLGERIADGAVVYRDVADTNPPLFLFLMVPFVWIGRALQIPTQVVWYVGVWAGFAFMVLLSARLSRRVISPGWLWPLLFLAAFQLAIADRIQFSQRDQLAAYAFLPLVFACAGRMVGIAPDRNWTIGAALFASVFLALKPYFLLPWLMIILLPWVWRNWRRLPLRGIVAMPEFWVVVAFQVLYVAAIALFCPAYWNYGALAAKYYKFLNPSMRLFFPLWPYVVCLSGICGMLFAQIILRTEWLEQKILALAVAASAAAYGFLIEAIIQRKALPYHLIPFYLFFWLVLAMVIVNLALTRLSTSWAYQGVDWIILSAGLGMVAIAIMTANTRMGPIYSDALRAEIESDRRPGTVMFLAGNPWCVFPLVYEARQLLEQRDFGFLWMLPGLYQDQTKQPNGHWKPAANARYHSPSAMPVDEKLTYDELRHVLSLRPRMIYVQTGDKAGMGFLNFDYLQYLSQDPEMAKELKDYSPSTLQAGKTGCEPRCFTLLVRRGDS